MTKKIDFSRYSSIKIGPTLDVKLINDCGDIKGDEYIIGGCNNLLISNTPPPLAVLSKKFDYIELRDGLLKIGAATPSGKIVTFCKKNNIGGFEFLSHLPGKLGGLVKMNAGLGRFETFHNLIYISTCKGKIKKDDLKYGYRYANIDGIVLEAVFKADDGFDVDLLDDLKQMRKNQPSHPSAGSCFKNPPNDYAGRLIEAVGLKGYKIGNMCFSDKHANFLVNLGGGGYSDALKLIEMAKQRVKKSFGVELECEIILL